MQVISALTRLKGVNEHVTFDKFVNYTPLYCHPIFDLQNFYFYFRAPP
jgi:hypothetical protein